MLLWDVKTERGAVAIKAIVEKKLILEFDLPGAIASMSRTLPSEAAKYGWVSPPAQLHRYPESWHLEIDLENAAETLATLRGLIAAIETHLTKES